MTEKLPPTARPSCGTSAGYMAHHRRGESACPACQAANRDRSRQRLATPEGRAAARATSREAHRRRRATPEGRAAHRAATLAATHAAHDRRRARTETEADADFLAKWPDGKPCLSCAEVLPASAFARNWTEPDGRERRCDRHGCRNRDRRLKRLARIADHRGLPADRCGYCETGAVEHIDHFHPLAKGGPDTLDNMVPACAPCNLAKSDRDPFEWLAATHPTRLDFFRALFPEETA